ncbi:uncharacterized protein LOC108672170 [Hyalella azteca]|uniref:Uncharacterized protein LOC108672170 n=1 Tax=Hyalella azteca TaxID=294128 RepID=A0A8B7NQA7_HYAAZ|nr:uncharacterized protein LOC108672170 [Hyalella azteca]
MVDVISSLQDCIDKLQRVEIECVVAHEKVCKVSGLAAQKVEEAVQELLELVQRHKSLCTDTVTRPYQLPIAELARSKKCLKNELEQCSQTLQKFRCGDCSEDQALLQVHSGLQAVQQALSVTKSVADVCNCDNQAVIKLSKNAMELINACLEVPHSPQACNGKIEEVSDASVLADLPNKVCELKTDDVASNSADFGDETPREIECDLDRAQLSVLSNKNVGKEGHGLHSFKHISSGYFSNVKSCTEIGSKVPKTTVSLADVRKTFPIDKTPEFRSTMLTSQEPFVKTRKNVDSSREMPNHLRGGVRPKTSSSLIRNSHLSSSPKLNYVVSQSGNRNQTLNIEGNVDGLRKNPTHSKDYSYTREQIWTIRAQAEQNSRRYSVGTMGAKAPWDEAATFTNSQANITGHHRSMSDAMQVDVEPIFDEMSKLLAAYDSHRPSSGAPMRPKPFHIESSAIVTVASNPSLFFYRNSQRFQDASKFLNYIVAPSAARVLAPVVGKVYLGRSRQDNAWYRVLVTARQEARDENNRKMSVVSVYFFDIGTTEDVSYDRLRICPSELEHQPTLAIPCCLAGVLPPQSSEAADALETAGDHDPPNAEEKITLNEDSTEHSKDSWNEESVKVFRQLVLNANLQIFFMGVEDWKYDQKKFQVELRRVKNISGVTSNESLSVREVLLTLGLARPDAASKHLKDESSGNKTPLRQFFKPEMTMGQEEFVVLTSCDSPHHFHVVLDGPDNSDQLDKLHHSLQKFYSSLPSLTDWIIFLPKIGEACVARSSVNGLWYRALIEGICSVVEPGELFVKVFFVDSGRRESLRYNQLCKIRDSFMKFPAQAITCHLANVMPLEAVPENEDSANPSFWNKEAKEIVDAFIDTLTDRQSYTATFHGVDNHGAYLVNLIVHAQPQSSLDLANHLVRLGHARHHFSWEPSTNEVAGLDGQLVSRLNTFISDTQRTGSIAGRMALAPFNDGRVVSEVICEPPIIGTRSAIGVVYLSVISPSAIFLRLRSRTHLFNKLQSELDSALDEAAGVEGTPLAGKLYLAVFDRKPYLARAKILELQQDCNVKVLLVDCGELVSVQASSLRELQAPLAAIKPMAFLASLHDIVAPGDQQKWPCTTTDALKDILSSVSSLFVLKQGSSSRCTELYRLKVIPVSLWYSASVISGDPGPPNAAAVTHRISVSQQLLQAGLALRLRTHENVKSADGSYVASVIDCNEMETKNPFSPLECGAVGVGSADPNDCVLPESKQVDDQMKNGAGGSFEEEFDSFLRDQRFENKGSVNNTQANDINSEKRGNEEAKSSSSQLDLVPKANNLSDMFSHSHQNSFRHDLQIKKGKSSSYPHRTSVSLRYDHEISEESSRNAENRADVSLYSESNEPLDTTPTAVHDVQEYFRDGKSSDRNEGALSSKFQWLPNPDRLSGSFSAIPTYVDVFGRIHLHPVKSEHCLELLRDTLLTHFRHSFPEMASVSQSNLKCGDDLVARYESDYSWNRCTIVEIMNDVEVEVLFVDYGNKEVVNVKNLRRTQLFANLPIQRHVCTLADVEPDNPLGKWEKTVLDSLHVYVVEKTCRVTVVSDYDTRTDFAQIDLVVEHTNSSVSNWLVQGIKKCRWSIQSSVGASSGRKKKRNKGRNTGVVAAQSRPCNSALIQMQMRDASYSAMGLSGRSDEFSDKAPPAVELPPLPLPSCGIIFPVHVSAFVKPDSVYIIMNFPDLAKPPNDPDYVEAVCAILSNGPPPHACPYEKVEDGKSDFCLVCVQFEQAIQQKYFLLYQLASNLQLNAVRLPAVTRPAAGHICLAYISHSEKWQRCQILAAVDIEELQPDQLRENEISPTEESPLFRVFLLDFGSDVIVPLAQMRVLPRELADIPAQAICVRLHGISNGAGPDEPWDYETSKKMIETIFPACLPPIYAIIVSKPADSPIEVELYQSSSQHFDPRNLSLVYQPLIDAGLLAYHPGRAEQLGTPNSNH